MREVWAGSFLKLSPENVKLAIPALIRVLWLQDQGIMEESASQLSLQLPDIRS